MKNEYEIRGDITAIFIKCKLGSMETIISTHQLEKVIAFPNIWSAVYCKNTKSFYAKGNFTISRGVRVNCGMHRWIMDLPKGRVVDHFNHDTLDNTDKNLRILTNSENLQNRRGATKTNGSGVRGISWDKRRNKWQVRLKLEGKNIFFGYFDSLIDAELVSIEARRKHMPYSQDAS